MMMPCAMTEAFAKEICGWKYESPYSVYNYPDWETCRAGRWDITSEGKWKREYIALVTREEGRDVLCGFLRFMPGSAKGRWLFGTGKGGSVALGLGLRPDLCGRGYGAELMRIALREYKRRYRGLSLELYVRPFNERAIKLYTKSGFTVTGRMTGHTSMGEAEFLHMRYGGE